MTTADARHAIGASRIYHVNVNCSDLDRSLRFYRDVVGLHTTVRTAPDHQPGGAFGLDVAQWDAWILAGDAGTDGVVLDLLEWQQPTPSGTPPASIATRGFSHLRLGHPDLDALHDALADDGCPALAPPASMSAPEHTQRSFFARDPDGTLLEFVEANQVGVVGVSVGCVDLDAALDVYRGVMGLAMSQSGEAELDLASVGLDTAFAGRWARCVDAATSFGVDLLEWPPGTLSEHAGRMANELGIFRMAWTTDDIDRDHAVIASAGLRCYSPPVRLDMNLGEHSVLRALFFEDRDGACLELIEPPDVVAAR
ncbi:MAG: VOC family protein [Acidimicrobiales bacterium]|nr:VOC family protein [Acidimicrobiales bacterium]